MTTFTLKTFYTRKNLRLKVTKSTLPKFANSKRCYASALFIPRNIANKTFSFLTPELDYKKQFADIQKLQNDINRRGLNINAEELRKSLEYFQFVENNKNTLEKKMNALSMQCKTIYKENKDMVPEENAEVQALKAQIKLIREDLKVIKETVWDLEATIIPKVLKLPNEIDERTPDETSILLKSVGEKPKSFENKNHSHIEMGKNLGLLEYNNPLQYFLCNEAAFFELGVLALAGRIMRENNFTRIAGPDFCRSLMVEGSGLDHENPMESFILQNMDGVDEKCLVNRLHLLGGASATAMLSLYVKTLIKRSKLPIRVFSTGRQYKPFSNTPEAYGLFSACQSSAVHALIQVNNTDEQYKNEFQNLIEVTSKIYDEIGCHYQIVIRPVKELHTSECMRVSFEMWSVFLNQYIEVGHVSACGDYFSKRLLLAYESSKKTHFQSSITGTLLSVPRVLGCLLEENPDKFSLPQSVNMF